MRCQDGTRFRYRGSSGKYGGYHNGHHLTAAAAAAYSSSYPWGNVKGRRKRRKPVKPQVSRDAVEQLREEYGVREDEED